MAQTSVPDVLINLQQQLAARPGLADVPVYLIDLGVTTDPEAVGFTRCSVAGAGFFGWGGGEASRATVEPPTLGGYVWVQFAGDDTTKAVTAIRRAGVLLGEIMQQLRDDPFVGGALAPPRLRSAPLMQSAVWTMGLGEQNRVSIVGVNIDWTITWNATTT